MSHEQSVSGKIMHFLFQRALIGSITPELRSRLEGEGIDTEGRKERYPWAQLVRSLELIADELYPGQIQSDQLRALGKRVVMGVEKSGIIPPGGLFTGRLIGPMKLLQMATIAPPRGAEFLKLQIRDLGKKHIEIEVNEGQTAEFLAGTLETFFELLKQKARPTIITASPERAVIDVRW